MIPNIFFLGVALLLRSPVNEAFPFRNESHHDSDNQMGDLVYGGQPAQQGWFPWQVYIELGNFVCGGSIVNPRTIVTAAHCHFDQNHNRIPASQVRIYAGSIHRGQGVKVWASKTIVHGYYKPDQDGGPNDIAVIQLQQALQFNNDINQINLTPPNTDYTGSCYLSGFGSTTNRQGSISDSLMYAYLNLRPDSDCDNSDWGHFDDASMVCAGGDNGSNQCAGDSGGPLACYVNDQFFLYGAVSRGPSDCSYPSPGSYSSISYWNSWIRGNMA